MGLELNWHKICNVHAKDLQEGLGGSKANIYVDIEHVPWTAWPGAAGSKFYLRL